MAKTTSKSTASKPFQFGAPLAPLIGPQIEQFWTMQDNLLNESQRFTQHWFERRHAAVRSGLDAARAISRESLSNPMTAITLLSDWQKHSAERLAEDAQEWFETMSRCAEYAIKTEAETLDETLSEASELTRKVTKSAKSEPV